MLHRCFGRRHQLASSRVITNIVSFMFTLYTPRQIVRRLKQERHIPRFLAARFLWRTGLSKYFSIDNGRFQLVFFPTALSSALWYTPDARSDDETFFYDFLRPGDVVVDVGAN